MSKTTYEKDNGLKNEPNQLLIHPGDEVGNGFKWILLLGRIIGASPICVSFGSASTTLAFRWLSLSTIHCLFLAVTTFLVLVPELRIYFLDLGSHPTILDEMVALGSPLYYFTIVSVYWYWLQNALKILELFSRWPATMAKLKLMGKESGFTKFCWKISLLALGPSVLEVMMYNWYHMTKDVPSEEGTLIERLYKSNLRSFSDLVPHYSSITSVILIYVMTAGYYAWTFVDIFLILLCRAITHSFGELNEEINLTLSDLEANSNLYSTYDNSDYHHVQLHVQENEVMPERNGKEMIWRKIREKLFLLSGLANDVTGLVAPLLLIIYGFCILDVIVNLLRSIYESNMDISPIVYINPCKFAVRVVLATYYAAKVYHSTEDILKTIETQPDYVCSPTAFRLESWLARHPVGVTIAGTVTITRRTFISILTFIFTTEIVMLQAMSANSIAKTI